jgi:hypothetical protein
LRSALAGGGCPTWIGRSCRAQEITFGPVKVASAVRHGSMNSPGEFIRPGRKEHCAEAGLAGFLAVDDL